MKTILFFLILLPTSVSAQNRLTAASSSLAWGSYFGGIGEDYGQSITCDSLGYMYVAGFTNSNSRIATPGAYQSTFGGGAGSGGDAVLSKFTSSGTIQWSTYYGGSGNDGGWAIALDDSGNVYMSGYTSSLDSIATVGSHQSTLGGNSDVFLAKFSNTGVLKWATYYGGSGADAALGIICDHSGNVYMCGQTSSTDSIASVGSYQSTNGGLDDAFLAKFNGNGNLIWATYYGGSNEDRAYALTLDINGNIYITGTTLSSDSISTSGTYQSSYGGNEDAFIAKFNNSGGLLWASYIGGRGQESGYSITADSTGRDGSGNIYVTGVTSSTDSIATIGSYQSSYGGGSLDGFVSKFNTSGVLLWSTYYGGGAFDQSLGIACDGLGNIFITGGTQSTDSIATSSSYQSSIGGYTDAFLAEFNSAGHLVWSSYYGGGMNQNGADPSADVARPHPSPQVGVNPSHGGLRAISR